MILARLFRAIREQKSAGPAVRPPPHDLTCFAHESMFLT